MHTNYCEVHCYYFYIIICFYFLVYLVGKREFPVHKATTFHTMSYGHFYLFIYLLFLLFLFILPYCYE
jgi:hypothetical protein